MVEEMVLKIKQAPNEPGVREMKDALREQYGGTCLKVFKQDNAFWYRIDTDAIDDMAMFAEAIRFTISDEDFARYFDTKTPQEALGEIGETVSAALSDALPARLSADICAKQQISQGQYLIELTCNDGACRIRAIASAEQVGRMDIGVNQKVTVSGHWRFEEQRGGLELVLDFIQPSEKPTDFDQFKKMQMLRIHQIENSQNARAAYPLDKQIAEWEKIVLLTNEEKTAEDFIKILKKKQSPIHCDIVYVRFSEDALSYKLRELSEKKKYDAICIIKGVPKNMYSFQALYSAEVYEAINESKIPVLAGVGREEDQPYGLRIADCSAATYSVLAVQINEWQKLKQVEEEHGSLFGMIFRKIFKAINPFS